MKILVTGGAGYIGSHTTLELLQSGHQVVVLDNLSNSSAKALTRIEILTGTTVPFYPIDLRDEAAVQEIFMQHTFDCCIHFAGLKSVAESVCKPLDYYENNVLGTLHLLQAMQASGCKNLIFSSSATVYGEPAQIPIPESCPKGRCSNPYGQTKSVIEEMLYDLYNADRTWNIVLLRYFNPIGAHPSGQIGENPNGTPANLMPLITRVALGKQPMLQVFGDDYDTPDGTGVRDYIHVVDLAQGHLKALNAILSACGFAVYNLGTGVGYSVLELIRTFEAVNGLHIPYCIQPRRPGDLAVVYADPQKAARELGWTAARDIRTMCRDAWNWQQKNPNGYE